MKMIKYYSHTTTPKDKNSHYVQKITTDPITGTEKVEMMFQKLSRERADRIATALNNAYTEGRSNIILKLHRRLARFYESITGEEL